MKAVALMMAASASLWMPPPSHAAYAGAINRVLCPTSARDAIGVSASRLVNSACRVTRVVNVPAILEYSDLPIDHGGNTNVNLSAFARFTALSNVGDGRLVTRVRTFDSNGLLFQERTGSRDTYDILVPPVTVTTPIATLPPKGAVTIHVEATCPPQGCRATRVVQVGYSFPASAP